MFKYQSEQEQNGSSPQNGQSSPSTKVRFKYQLEQQQQLEQQRQEQQQLEQQRQAQQRLEQQQLEQQRLAQQQKLEQQRLAQQQLEKQQRLIQQQRQAQALQRQQTQQPAPVARPQSVPQQRKQSAPAKKKKGYQASVPMTVYRDLAQETQTLRTEMEELRNTNAALVAENEQMHRTLASIAAALQTTGVGLSPEPDVSAYAEPEVEHDFLESSEPEFPAPPLQAEPEDWVMSVEAPGQQALLERLRKGELNGILMWILVGVLLLITLGGSFTLMRLILGSDRPAN
ncbi:MAG: hypothetical protein F6J87_05825 [Spirulina sp. SIO3F2]|nr:hypothetical protein [Spirulina sp. SIO3F2]